MRGAGVVARSPGSGPGRSWGRAPALAFVVLVACGRGASPSGRPEREATPSEPAAAEAPSPGAEPPAAVEAAPGADRAELCRQYQAQLVALASGPPPQLGDQAPGLRRGEPRIAGSPNIPMEDWDLSMSPIDVSNGKLPTPLPPRLYVRAAAGSPAAAVATLRAKVPSSTELRLLVERTDDELRANQLAVFPRTPPAVLAKIPTIVDEGLVAMLVEAAGTCREVLTAFQQIAQGATIIEIGPATAEALAACDCQLADLDAYVTLLGGLLLIPAGVGAVEIRTEVLDALAPRATVDDLARALLAPR